MKLFRLSLIAASLAAAFSNHAQAQQAPDAGQTLQIDRQAPQPTRTGPGVDVQQPTTTPIAPGGVEVVLKSISIAGATVFTAAELLDLLGAKANTRLDMAGLRGLAEKISEHYRQSGYPFARAFLPQQSLTEGKLRIEVVEGRYGKVQALGESEVAAAASGFLSSLQSNSVIESTSLERATLILDDQPGVTAAPIIRPGQEIGTGDLDVRVTRTPGFTGEVGLDNHGNRYTGEHRVRANVDWNGPFAFGDQLALRALGSDEGMWLGSIGYNLPLGSTGLRGNIGYANTYYKLAKDFAGQGDGTAKVYSLGLTYPVVRSQKANLNFAATWQQKQLNDSKVTANEEKTSESVPLALNFDRRDTFLGGGITYGSLSYTSGNLKLDTALQNTDTTSAQNTRGSFDKWNLDIARVQATAVSGLVLFGRASAQSAGKNLDSSEGFSIGGANGVRAYPGGEGNGDEGWLVQLEARYTMGAFSPYVFHDSGYVTLNAKNANLTTPANPNYRAISGEGFGVRYSDKNWTADVNIAWSSMGGKAQSDSVDRSPRAWLSIAYKF